MNKKKFQQLSLRKKNVKIVFNASNFKYNQLTKTNFNK